jgi:hypothetical protein
VCVPTRVRLCLCVSELSCWLPVCLPLRLCVCGCVGFSACLPACPPVCLCTSFCVCLPACMSACLPAYGRQFSLAALPGCPPACRPARLPARLPACHAASLCASACLSVRLSVCDFPCLPVCLGGAGLWQQREIRHQMIPGSSALCNAGMARHVKQTGAVALRSDRIGGGFW